MDIEKAIDCLQADKEYLTDMKICDGEEMDVAIKALEKQIPKKPVEYEDKYYGCTVCGNVLMIKWVKYPTVQTSKKCGLPYCMNCGQAIDWSD